MLVYTKTHLSCAHQLNLPYESPCNRLHGHDYLVEVWLRGDLDEHGMVVDFTTIKQLLRQYDHQNLNELFLPTTAEMFVRHLRARLSTLHPNIRTRVRVWETDNCYAEEGDA